ncbi:ATP-dependent helicase [Spiroplasma endosymbiont of Nebria brevicollis]|uniref:ATP-dependent helicase n=1 Tax=Spiroplasma endosymbiont of Nebria brevicollis TaxID=3066284 RepID=UPI00313DBF0B
MDKNKLLNNLNDQQLQAVINIDGPCRIIAGVGVGKTRVLTYKIAYLINVIKIPSEKILALTFTNKAAKEMKLRVVQLLENDDIKVTIATYHAICAKILRKDIHNLKINNSFNIIDQEDQRKILKDIYQKEFSNKVDLAELRLLSSSISNWKNHHTTYDELVNDYQNQDQWILRAKVYESYKQYQTSNSCLDFDDLLLLVQRLFKEFPHVLKKWQDQFSFILVDEFQDTNDIQYSLLLSLSTNHNNITVVGDPDQTIYSWRGANINLILNFTKKFPNTQTFILNENFRSTTKILNIANSLIKNNVQRIDKSLFTKNDMGSEVVVYHASSSTQEAHWVATSIKKIHLKYHLGLNNIAILYRNNYLSKDLEQALINNNINYKIFGGYKFFERKEIRDILAYLKVIAWNDNLSMVRILNATPKIGPKAIDHLLELAKQNSLSLNEYLFQYQYNLPKNYRQHLQPLIKLISDIQKNIEDVTSLHKLTEQVLAETNYLKTLEENLETERIQNLQQLLTQLLDFDSTNETKGTALLTSFLQEASLYTDLDENSNAKAVSLMTIHSAKGLEFDVVFIIGINEGILPGHSKNNDKDNKIEEERRLFYVAITRAKKYLFLSSADGFSFFLNAMKQPSRFLKDLDITHLKIINNEHQEMAESYQNRSNSKFNYFKFDANKDNNQAISNDWKVGDIIVHEIFGKGVITKLIGDKIQVAFHKNNGGIRILSATHNAIKKFV